MIMIPPMDYSLSQKKRAFPSPQKYRLLVVASAGLLFLLCCVFLQVPHIFFGGMSLVLTAALFTSVQQQQRLQQRVQDLQAQLSACEAQECSTQQRRAALRQALHDLRNPLTSVSLALHMLKKSGGQNREHHLQRLDESLQQALALLDTVSDIQRSDPACPQDEQS